VEKGNFNPNPQHPPLLKELAGLSLILGGIHWPHTPAADKLLSGDYLKRSQPEWDIGNQLISDTGPDRVLFWARLPFLPVACALMVTVYLWGKQLFGRLAALGALMLCSLDPNILGHSVFVTMDVGLAAAGVAFFCAIWNYIRNPTLTRLFLCGAALAGVLGAKFSGIFFVPVAGALLLAAVIRPPKPEPGRTRTQLDPYFAETPDSAAFRVPATKIAARIAPRGARRNDNCPCGSGNRYKACHGRAGLIVNPHTSHPRVRAFVSCSTALVAMCLVAFLFIQALYFFPSDPLIYYHGIKTVNADHDPNYQMYFAGRLQRTFWYYFGAAYLLKEPIAGIAFAAIGLVVLIRSRSITRFQKAFVVLPPAAIFAAHTALADNIGIRYILPSLPFLHLIGGVGFAALLQKPKWGRYTALTLCAWLIIGAAGIYPDHASYFNEAACLLRAPGRIGLDGGSKCGTFWMDDSNVDWGQGLKQLKIWLDRNAPSTAVRYVDVYRLPPQRYLPSAELADLREIDDAPLPRLYAISGHLVARFPADPEARTSWLGTKPPIAVVGHELYLYDFRPPGAK